MFGDCQNYLDTKLDIEITKLTTLIYRERLILPVDLGISQRAYYRYLEKLGESGILKVESQGRRKLYRFEKLLELLSFGT